MIDDLIIKVKGPEVVKTKDPQFKEAKLILNKMIEEVAEYERTINYFDQIKLTLQKLSDTSLNLSEDIDNFFSEGPESEVNKAKTHLNFSIHFSALTNNFFIPRTNVNINYIFEQTKKQINDLCKLKEDVKILRDLYDKQKAVFDYLSKNGDKNDEKLCKEAQKMCKCLNQYSSLNTEFINTVKKLNDDENTFQKPFKNMICLISQYLMQIFREIQKFRTTYPPDLFVYNSYLDKNKNEEESLINKKDES